MEIYFLPTAKQKATAIKNTNVFMLEEVRKRDQGALRRVSDRYNLCPNCSLPDEAPFILLHLPSARHHEPISSSGPEPLESNSGGGCPSIIPSPGEAGQIVTNLDQLVWKHISAIGKCL